MKYMFKGHHWIRPTHDVISTIVRQLYFFGCSFCMLDASVKHLSGSTYVEAAVISYG